MGIKKIIKKNYNEFRKKRALKKVYTDFRKSVGSWIKYRQQYNSLFEFLEKYYSGDKDLEIVYGYFVKDSIKKGFDKKGLESFLKVIEEKVNWKTKDEFEVFQYLRNNKD